MKTSINVRNKPQNNQKQDRAQKYMYQDVGEQYSVRIAWTY